MWTICACSHFDYRDEPDSSAPQKSVGVNSAGDAPAFKPGHARRPSNSAPKDLEPINEDCAAPKKEHDSESEKEDTVKANTVKEVKEVWLQLGHYENRYLS